MADKIEGEFLKIDDDGEECAITYLDEEQQVRVVRVRIKKMYFLAARASTSIEPLQREILALLEAMKDPNAVQPDILVVRNLWMLLQRYRIEAIFPEMYVAHCKGEPLRQFFYSEANAIDQEQQKAQNPKKKAISVDEEGSIPKHEMIKDGVDRLLDSLRQEEPGTTLEKAKRVYGNLHGLTFENVNKSYHYKPKK